MKELIKLSQARKYLREAKDLIEIKQIKDVAKATFAFAKAKGLSKEIQDDAGTLVIEAGIEFSKMKKIGQAAGEIVTIKDNRYSKSSKKELLDFGVTKKESYINDQFAKDAKATLRFIEDLKKQNETVTEGAVLRKIQIKERKERQFETVELPKGKYKVIYADPPWEYNNSGFKNSAESNYPTMSLNKICDMPIVKHATDETILFLWATNPLITEALKVMGDWCFEYKTHFVWIKDKARGWAWWAKSKHELLLVGVKKDSGTPVKSFDSVFFEKRENKHSKKPKYVYEMIETMFPKQTDSNSNIYLELFQREPRPGWDGYGNEL